jgi:hypothetical protein
MGPTHRSEGGPLTTSYSAYSAWADIGLAADSILYRLYDSGPDLHWNEHRVLGVREVETSLVDIHLVSDAVVVERVLALFDRHVVSGV